MHKKLIIKRVYPYSSSSLSNCPTAQSADQIITVIVVAVDFKQLTFCCVVVFTAPNSRRKMPKSMGALCLLATAATAAELQPGLLEDPSCFFDNATGSHSYVGGNIFGDKHDVNSTASAEACCTLCKQYAAQGDGCVFWQFSTQGCYGHPAGCCRLKDQTAWAGRGPGDAYTTSGSIQAFPGPTPAPPPPAPVHAAVDWSAAPVRIASTAATVEVDVMPFLGRTPEGGPFDAYRTVSDWYLNLLTFSYFYLLATDSLIVAALTSLRVCCRPSLASAPSSCASRRGSPTRACGGGAVY